MIKTLLQVALRASSSFAAASLFLLSNLLSHHSQLFVDLLGEETEEKLEKPGPTSSHTLGNVSGVLVENVNGGNQASSKFYETSLAWELDAFKYHVHPTVQSFAEAISQRDSIRYSGDPLHDFSIVAFLDKFAYKNPKKKKSSEMSVFGSHGREQRLGRRAANEMPVNSEAFHEKFANHRPKKGEETDRFFFRYFDFLKRQGVKLASGSAAGREANLEELEDNYAEQLVENLLKKAAGGQEADMDDDILDYLSPHESADEEELNEDIDADILGHENDNDDDGSESDDEVVDDEEDNDEEDSDNEFSVFADADDFEGLVEGAEDEIEDDTKHKKPAKTKKHSKQPINKKRSKVIGKPASRKKRKL